MKFIRILLVSILTIMSVGCATQQGINTLTGVGAGALTGLIIGDSPEAAQKGAILGGIIGAFLPIANQQSVNQRQVLAQQPVASVGELPAGWSCPVGSVWQSGKGCFVANKQSVQGYQPVPSKVPGWCHNPYKVDAQGRINYNGGFSC